jgi:hypothetical protein
MSNTDSPAVAGILALAQRLRSKSRQHMRMQSAADLRLASHYLRFLAKLLIAEAARSTIDPEERAALIREAEQLRLPGLTSTATEADVGTNSRRFEDSVSEPSLAAARAPLPAKPPRRR